MTHTCISRFAGDTSGGPGLGRVERRPRWAPVAPRRGSTRAGRPECPGGMLHRVVGRRGGRLGDGAQAHGVSGRPRQPLRRLLTRHPPKRLGRLSRRLGALRGAGLPAGPPGPARESSHPTDTAVEQLVSGRMGGAPVGRVLRPAERRWSAGPPRGPTWPAGSVRFSASMHTGSPSRPARPGWLRSRPPRRPDGVDVSSPFGCDGASTSVAPDG